MKTTSPAIVLIAGLCLPFFAAAALTYEQAVAEHRKHDADVQKHERSIKAEEDKLNRNCGAFACQNQDIKQRIVYLGGLKSRAEADRLTAAKACHSARGYLCPAGGQRNQCLQTHPCPAEGGPADPHSKDKVRPNKGLPAKLENLNTPADGILLVNTYQSNTVWFTVYDASRSQHLDTGCVQPRKNRIANTEGIRGRIKDNPNAKFYVRAQAMETQDCKGAQYCDTTAEARGRTITYAIRSPNTRDCFIDTKY